LCDRNKTKLCNQTFGYIKIESEYYAIASNNTNSKYSNSGVKTCQDVQSIIGELTSSGGLCLGGTNSGSLADSVYVMSGRSDSIFSNGTKSILIKSTINSHVLNNLVDSKFFFIIYIFLSLFFFIFLNNIIYVYFLKKIIILKKKKKINKKKK